MKTIRVANAYDLYQKFYLKKGMILGDIKFNPLIKDLSDAVKFIQMLNSGELE